MAGGFATATGDVLNSTERFVRSSWSSLTGAGRFLKAGTMHVARGRHSATNLNRNTILMAGGYDGVVPLASAEIYNIARQTFQEVGAMNTPRYRHTATPLQNGTVLIAGGADAGGALSSAELFHVQPPGLL
jgi:hypothetical protein